MAALAVTTKATQKLRDRPLSLDVEFLATDNAYRSINSRRTATSLPHQGAEHPLSFDGIVEVHLDHPATLWVHGGFPQLIWVHFSQTFITLNIKAARPI